MRTHLSPTDRAVSHRVVVAAAATGFAVTSVGDCAALDWRRRQYLLDGRGRPCGGWTLAEVWRLGHVLRRPPEWLAWGVDGGTAPGRWELLGRHEIARRLVAARREAGLSVHELGELAGVPWRRLTDLGVSGRLALGPRLDEVERLSHALHIAPGWLGWELGPEPSWARRCPP